MNRFTLALGSNVGNPITNLKLAVKEFSSFARVLEVSPCFETPPLLPPDAPTEWFRFFANAAITIETYLTAQELLGRTQGIEQRLGRAVTRERWSPRPLDIDILFSHPYQEFHSPTLTLPHPEWTKRSFVLAPLLHLTPPEKIPGAILPLSRQLKDMPPALMAAINATPDSFSQATGSIDGAALIENFKSLLEKNVAFVDIGGESTRPGATPLTWQEEWKRIEPLLQYWKSVSEDYPFTKLSLDTRHAETAQKALDYEVSVLNDVSSLTSPAMRELAPHFDSVVLMHSLTVPADKNVVWANDVDVIGELKTWFNARMEDLSHLSQRKIIFDPGLGFGKNALQSLQILQRADELGDLPVRLLIGHSRKSFMANFSNTPAYDRDIETLGASMALATKNIEILRVHNVDWHQRSLKAFLTVSVS